MANPFTVAVPNALEALMAGEAGYKGMNDMAAQRALRGAQQAAQADIMAGDTDSAIARLIGAGDARGATALGAIQAGANGVYGTPIYGTDAQGNTVLGAMDKRGGFRRIDTGGVTPTPGVRTIDTGTGHVIIDSRSGRPMQGGAMQPGQPAQSAQAPGFIPKDIRGQEREQGLGQNDAKMVANRDKAAATIRDLDSQWKLVDDTINTALKEIDWTNAGLLGSATSGIPGTPAYNLARVLETIKANVGFDKLQSMRDNSPTGGALGQVSEFENRLLQSVRGSMEQGQSPARIRANLQRIQSDLKALQAERKRAFQQTYSGIQQRSAAPAQGQPQSMAAPPDGAIQALQNDLSLRDQFDAKYGAGAAARVLGQ